ncbi:unnamed protein product [Amoebophrya sp. A120]|nr:unnamed protein product [Amoebophrya sp. A120]|eukprot:GSA120T00013155001.1
MMRTAFLLIGCLSCSFQFPEGMISVAGFVMRSGLLGATARLPQGGPKERAQSKAEPLDLEMGLEVPVGLEQEPRNCRRPRARTPSRSPSPALQHAGAPSSNPYAGFAADLADASSPGGCAMWTLGAVVKCGDIVNSTIGKYGLPRAVRSRTPLRSPSLGGLRHTSEDANGDSAGPPDTIVTIEGSEHVDAPPSSNYDADVAADLAEASTPRGRVAGTLTKCDEDMGTAIRNCRRQARAPASRSPSREGLRHTSGDAGGDRDSARPLDTIVTIEGSEQEDVDTRPSSNDYADFAAGLAEASSPGRGCVVC